MQQFKLHAIFGLILLMAGIAFDFGFVTRNFTESFKTNPVDYLNSWGKYTYELVRFYLFALGFINIAFALLIPRLGGSEGIKWIILGLMVCGSILLIAGGLWEARIGPVFKMEPPCYVLGVGLFAVLSSLALVIYVFLSGKHL